jgi:flavin reductase (DIM6/NTAB) family NADH-FMN oxidoreductase RutF
MLLDLKGDLADRAYPILASLICPRPIAWVTTLNDDDSVNAAPFSFFNLMGTEPPLVVFCPGDQDDGTPKDTARNAQSRGEFVLHLVDEPLAEAMVRTSATHPYGKSETAQEGLLTTPSATLSTPRLTEAPVALECRVHSIQRIGQNRLVFGLIEAVHVRDDLYDPEHRKIRTDLYHPLGRMAVPNWYCTTREQFEIVRPA